MASITACGLKAGKRAKDKQGSDKHLSKVVELNGKYRLFFRQLPIVDEETGETITDEKDLATALVPGRTLDYDVCQASFFPLSKDQFTTNSYGEIVDNTGLAPWARIARVLFEAQCVREKKNAESEAERTAKELNQPVDQVALAKTLEGIELSYHGGRAANGTRINPTKKPAISNIQQKMTTHLAVVKLLPTGAPDWKNAQYAVLEIANQRMDELISLISDVNFVDMSKDYIEVGYDYIGADKQAAGKAAKFQGIVKNMSLESMFPAEWEAEGKKFIQGIANGENINEVADIIISRNRNLKGNKTPNDIITAFKQWCAKNAAVFASIDFEDDRTQRAAAEFLESHVVDSVPMIKAKFESIVAEQKSQKADDTTVTEEVVQTPVVDEVQKEAEQVAQAQAIAEAGAGQTLKQLASSNPNIDLTSDDDIELGDL